MKRRSFLQRITAMVPVALIPAPLLARFGKDPLVNTQGGQWIERKGHGLLHAYFDTPDGPIKSGEGTHMPHTQDLRVASANEPLPEDHVFDSEEERLRWLRYNETS